MSDFQYNQTPVYDQLSADTLNQIFSGDIPADTYRDRLAKTFGANLARSNFPFANIVGSMLEAQQSPREQAMQALTANIAKLRAAQLGNEIQTGQQAIGFNKENHDYQKQIQANQLAALDRARPMEDLQSSLAFANTLRAAGLNDQGIANSAGSLGVKNLVTSSGVKPTGNLNFQSQQPQTDQDSGETAFPSQSMVDKLAFGPSPDEMELKKDLAKAQTEVWKSNQIEKNKSDLGSEQEGVTNLSKSANQMRLQAAAILFPRASGNDLASIVSAAQGNSAGILNQSDVPEGRKKQAWTLMDQADQIEKAIAGKGAKAAGLADKLPFLFQQQAPAQVPQPEPVGQMSVNYPKGSLAEALLGNGAPVNIQPTQQDQQGANDLVSKILSMGQQQSPAPVAQPEPVPQQPTAPNIGTFQNGAFQMPTNNAPATNRVNFADGNVMTQALAAAARQSGGKLNDPKTKELARQILTKNGYIIPPSTR